jgi:hypothetical protein
VRGVVSCLSGPPTGLLVPFLVELVATGFAGPAVGILVITGDLEAGTGG